MLFSAIAYAGTPQVNDLTIIYGAVIILFGGIIGTGYLIKFIKNRKKISEEDNRENGLSDEVNPMEMGND